MSAIEQPAARSGRIDPLLVGGEDVGALGHEVHAAEDDELRVRPGRRLAGQLERVAGDVGELDDLVALVVVAEHEDPVAERRLGRAGPLDQVGVAGRGQVARAVDAALGVGVAAPARAAAARRRCWRVRSRSRSRAQWSHARRGRVPMRCVTLPDCLHMRVLICPDKFAGTLTAVEAAAGDRRGLARGRPRRRAGAAAAGRRRPRLRGGARRRARRAAGSRSPTVDPLGRPVAGEVLLAGDTAYVESAQACGLHLLAAGRARPEASPPRTAWALLLAAAVEAGARRGRDRAGRLGHQRRRRRDARRARRRPGGRRRLRAAVRRRGAGRRGRRWPARPGCAGCALVAATDVDNPLIGLHGASNVFGPQKGATRADVLLLDAALARFAGVLEQDLAGVPARAGRAARRAARPAGSAPRCSPSAARCESGIGLVRAADRAGRRAGRAPTW